MRLSKGLRYTLSDDQGYQHKQHCCVEVKGPYVVMQMVPRYQNLLQGAELVESQLKESFSEYLNAEIALRTVTDVSMAIAWLKGSFFYIRVRSVAGCHCNHATLSR